MSWGCCFNTASASLRMSSKPEPWLRVLGGKKFRFMATGLALVCAASTLGYIYQKNRTMADLEAFPAPGRMIAVNGTHYHLHCIGSGTPTVVLEAGLGESSLSWTSVHAQLAKTQRVCAYDRAGLGWSDPTETPMQPIEVAENLHTLLKNADISPPFVLIGHSRGGLFVRSFYHRYPDETAAIVLVDSTHEQGPLHQYPFAEWEYRKQAVLMAIAEPMSRVGLLRAFGLADSHRQRSPLPEPVLAAKTAVQNRSDTAQAVVNELSIMREGLDSATKPPLSLGNTPLLVLSAGNALSPDWVRSEAERQGRDVATELLLAHLKEMHQKQLVRLSTNSHHVVLAGSGHFIMYDKPDEFVGLVSAFLETLPFSD